MIALEPAEGNKEVLFDVGFAVVVEVAKAFSRPKQQMQRWGLFKVIISSYLCHELPANWTLALHLVQEQHNAWGVPDPLDEVLKKWAIWLANISSVQSSFAIEPELHFPGHFCKSNWFETDVVQMYRIRIRERHICILLWTLTGTEEFFIGVGNVGDTIGDDEVFGVVAIDAGFFVLVVESFDVNLVFVVVIFVVVDVVDNIVEVVVSVVAIVFDDVVTVFIVVDDTVDGCCDVVASELVVGGSLRANIQCELNTEIWLRTYEIV